MNERKFAVIGHPIGHTMSPFIHQRLFKLSGKPAEYCVYDIPQNELSTELTSLKQLNGFNITIPHKRAIIPFLDKLDKKASLFGSVNTVCNRNGIYTGYTTDPTGFLKALSAGNAQLKGRCVVLGSGGAARVMAFEAALAGCELTIAVRKKSLEKAQELSNEISQKIGVAKVTCCAMEDLTGSIDLLLNATPVGMYPLIDAVPVSETVIQNCAVVFDAVYNPNETKLLKIAKANGAKIINGMDMLVWQAVAAHEIWDEVEFSQDDINELCRDSVEEMNRIFKGGAK